MYSSVLLPQGGQLGRRKAKCIQLRIRYSLLDIRYSLQGPQPALNGEMGADGWSFGQKEVPAGASLQTFMGLDGKHDGAVLRLTSTIGPQRPVTRSKWPS